MGRDSAHLPLYSSGYGGPPRRPGGGGKSGGGLSLQACLVGVLLLSTLGMAYVAVSMHTELGHLRRALGEREAALQERGRPLAAPLLTPAWLLPPFQITACADHTATVVRPTLLRDLRRDERPNNRGDVAAPAHCAG